MEVEVEQVEVEEAWRGRGTRLPHRLPRRELLRRDQPAQLRCIPTPQHAHPQGV